MSIQYFLLFLGLMFPLVFSPGPANLVFALSGIHQGIKNSIPLIIGVNLVFIINSIVVGYGLGGILKTYPQVGNIFQIIGAFYIFYLAYKFFKSTNTKQNTNKKILFTFKDGLILQLFNPKGWSMLFLMFATLLDSSFNRDFQILSLIIMLAILNISTHFFWVIIGNKASGWINSSKKERLLNYFFALSLICVGIWILLTIT